MRYLIFTLLLSLLGCKPYNKPESNPIADDSIVADLSQSDVERKSALTYEYENDTLIQTITIRLISEKELSFTLISKNKQKDKSSLINGIARLDGTDPEIDEDEEGNAYPSQQYIFERDCWLSIKIDMELKDKIRVVEASCENHRDVSCPFNSVGILRKKE